MMLLIDLGNSRLKWARADAAGALGEVTAVAHDGDPGAALAGINPQGIRTVRVASVGDAALNTALQAALAGTALPAPSFLSTRRECAGLRIAYEQPQRLGVDRWLAMLGLWRRLQGPFCVASAGTALTFDAVDADGRHLGGLIAPGVSTMAESVLGRTRFDVAGLPQEPMPALGRDTETCVAQGALHAALGLLDRAAANAAGARFLCGGDALRLLPGLGDAWQLEPYAVMRGMQAAGD